MARRTALVPFQQGDLDGLCGIYALIKGLRVVDRDRPEILGWDVGKSTFAASPRNDAMCQ